MEDIPETVMVSIRITLKSDKCILVGQLLAIPETLVGEFAVVTDVEGLCVSV